MFEEARLPLAGLRVYTGRVYLRRSVYAAMERES